MDAAITYPWAFAAHAVTTPAGPSAPWTYWLTQPVAYIVIAPVAAVAAWRGIRQVEGAWEGRPQWWRLTAEASGVAVLLVIVAGILDPLSRALRSVLHEGIETAALVGVLGALLTATNYLLVRGLEPNSTAMRS